MIWDVGTGILGPPLFKDRDLFCILMWEEKKTPLENRSSKTLREKKVKTRSGSPIRDWGPYQQNQGVENEESGSKLCIMDQDLKFTSPRTRKYFGSNSQVQGNSLVKKKKSRSTSFCSLLPPENRNEGQSIFFYSKKNKISPHRGLYEKKMEKKKWLPFFKTLTSPYILLGHHGKSHQHFCGAFKKKTSFQMAFCQCSKGQSTVTPHPQKLFSLLQKARVSSDFH